MYHQKAIESFPLQIYVSALLFSPTASLVRQLFQHEEPEGITIKPGMSDSWSACLQTLEGHSECVYSVAFSHNSTWLASASLDKTVKIWDASSGECLQTLEGHSSGLNSVAFSHDSTQLASASFDKTVKIWEASSGACLQTLEGHSKWVRSVAFSHDSTRLASASHDKTVKIWEASSGACLQTLEGHSLSSASAVLILSSLHPKTVEPQQAICQKIAISSDGTWISDNAQNMLWLPAEYRPWSSAIASTSVGLGTGSGKVWVCYFT
jgi:WD40 repeat protein